MKTATKNLEDDHVHVLKLTDVMVAITRSENPDIEHISSIIDIIKNFADGLHHAKEENLFFPALALKGFSAQQGPVAVMLHEHAEGRSYVKGITENLELYSKGDKSAKVGMYQNMRGYAELLVNHIGKENNILFRMADKVLSEKEQNDLLSGFETVENDRPSGAKAADYIKTIVTLASFYKV
jgi:hemerythrin-like domain-containing protein